MTEDEARQIELVRAIELEDRESVLLTREDRAQAESHARGVGAIDRRGGADRFLAVRAEFAAARLVTRHPGVARLLHRSRWPRWLGIAIPIAALIAGFIANEFGTAKRFDLLAVPLLGTVAWNVAVYLVLLIGLISGSKGALPVWASRLLGRAAGLGLADLDRGSTLHRAASAFAQRWSAATAALSAARLARTLHLSAALFAGGLIGGIYLRALVIEYRAGWESTFLSPAAVHAVLSVVLGPASWLTGVAIPDVPGIAAIRWTGPATGGVNAAPWLVLYTVTVAGLVIVPRLALALWQGIKAWRLARFFPMPGRDDFYVRRLLRGAGSATSTVRITPYASVPDAAARARLTDALRAALGDGTTVRFDTPIDYGAEDTWLAANSSDPADDYHVLLFSLASTPEDENHGALAAELARRLKAEKHGTVLAALLDETPLRTRFAGQAGLDERIAGRISAWRTVLARAGITPLVLDLAGDDADLPQRLEGGLLGDGAMQR